VIIVAASLIGIVAVALTGADLRRLVNLPFRHLWLVWLAIGIQVGVLTLLADHVEGTLGDLTHLTTYALAMLFVIVNRRVPGVMILGLGAAANLTAIVANGGVMPASAAAWSLAGRATDTGFSNSLPIGHPRLLFLGDVFALPSGWPLANVFSIGDTLLVLGLIWMVSRGCRPIAIVAESFELGEQSDPVVV
jgi:hypothetical protein